MSQTAPHQAIYRRWRAQTFAQIVGQEAVVETLRNAVRTGRVAHAILFVGPRGTGKTSLARILAKALNCTDLRDGDPCDACPSCVAIREGRAMDLVEIDAASNRGIDAIRELRERINYAPTDLRRKVYILDEAHQITRDAWNALLKSLEEPPPFVAFMFASTEPSGFPPAILSRLQRYDVRRLTVPEIEGKLSRILAADGREADPAAIHLIARLAAGGMRDAESMLDQLLSAAPERIDEAHVRDLLGLADAEMIESFVDVLVRGDAAAGVALLDQLDERGRDIRALLDQVVEAIRLELVAGLRDPSSVRHDPVELASAGRRLAAIDPNRVGIGGLRFQLELAVFSPTEPSKLQARQPRVALPPAPLESSPALASAATGGSSPVSGPDRPTASRRPSEPARAGRAAVGQRMASPTLAEPPMSPPASSPRAEPANHPETSAAKAAGQASELDRLAGGWAAVVASVSPATRAVINECRPLSVDGNVVTLGFPEAKAFLKDVAARKASELDAAVGTYLGRAVNVRCVATNIELAPLPSADADVVLAEARRIFADDIVEIGEVS